MIPDPTELSIVKSDTLSCSYETRWSGGEGVPPQILVSRDSRQDLSSLAWIVKMLRVISPAVSRDIGLFPGARYGVKNKQEVRVDALIFDTPKESANVKPQTLRARLVDCSKPPPSLTERIRIAQTLVASVMILHSLGIVHRFMNPEGILLFSKEGPSSSLGDLYLLGLGQSRPDFGKTGNLQEDREFREKLYILTNPRTCKYEMRHDVFSLGVCLLEIALWQPFFIPYKDASERLKKMYEKKELHPEAPKISYLTHMAPTQKLEKRTSRSGCNRRIACERTRHLEDTRSRRRGCHPWWGKSSVMPSSPA